jgi:hypothetical protein
MTPSEEPWSPIGKTLAEMRANPEGMRAWEDLERRRWAELDAEMREDALAQARFDRKAKVVSTLGVAAFVCGLLILRAFSR